MKRHKDSHDGVISFCDKCTFTTTRTSLLKSHIAKMHNQKTLNCEKCFFQAHSYFDLNKHAKETHALVQEIQPCSECGHKESCEALLNVHMKKKHLQQNTGNYLDDPLPMDERVAVSSETVQGRHRIMGNFRKYVEVQTGGRSLAEVVSGSDGREMIFELFYCYLSSYKLSDGKKPTKEYLMKLKSSMKVTILDMFNVDLTKPQLHAQARWKKKLF